MKKQIAITALTLATAFGTAHAETINVGMSGGYFPFTFVKLDEMSVPLYECTDADYAWFERLNAPSEERLH